MAQKVYKTLMGWNEWNPGDKHEPTHRLLTVEEYDELEQRLRALEYRLREEQIQKEQAVKRAREDAFYAVQRAENETRLRETELESQLEAMREERDRQIALNANLLRINRERANAARGLTPKKQHSGYVVLQSQEREIRYPYGRGTRTMPGWETTLQTPYSVELSEETAREQIEREMNGGEAPGLLKKLGMEGAVEVDRLWQLAEGHEPMPNVAVRQKLRANYRAGYWEVSYTHTLALDSVPKELRGR